LAGISKYISDESMETGPYFVLLFSSMNLIQICLFF